MMRGATLVVIAILSVSLVVNATEYFYEDFEDGDVSDWNIVATPSHTATTVAFDGGAWGLEGMMVESSGATGGQMNQTGLSPAVGNTVWLGMDWRHTGNYNGGWGGAKQAAVWFLTATGEGYGLQVVANRNADLVDVMLLRMSTAQLLAGQDYNYPDGDGSWIASFENQSGIMSTDNWSEHRLEAKMDWDNYVVELYLDGVQVDQDPLVIDPGDAWMKDFVEVRVTHRQPYEGPYGWGYVIFDDLYAGDVRNPNTDPTIVGGDSNSDLLVNLVDLGALATSYGTGGNNWTQGDFNFDFTVDLVDLGILATNYGYDGTGGGVPEPATMALFGLAGLALLRRRS